jgi:hypothetical protein
MSLFFIVLFRECLEILAFIAGASAFEWTLHRYFMHRPAFFGKFRYPFEAHALVHHHIFKSDHTYHVINEKDKKKIPMAWWNGPAIVSLGISPLVVASFFVEGMWMATIIAAVVFGTYFWAYERMHWCMHLPRQRKMEMWWIFQRLNGHHLLHHRYMHKNFNVVCPFTDLCMGTLLLRSKTRFAQALGPSVPDVQPK